MTTTVDPVPAGQHGATPYLCLKGAAAGLDFYTKAFGAVETMRLVDPTDGRVGHAEIRIGDAVLMLADEYPEMGVVSPQTLGGSPVTIHLYVPDIDALVARAVAAGATLLRPVADQFYGDRAGRLSDPFGHVWHLASRKEDVSATEMRRRFDALYAK
jgi:PhnB protein